jgi:hypothetical protein
MLMQLTFRANKRIVGFSARRCVNQHQSSLTHAPCHLTAQLPDDSGLGRQLLPCLSTQLHQRAGFQSCHRLYNSFPCSMATRLGLNQPLLQDNKKPMRATTPAAPCTTCKMVFERYLYRKTAACSTQSALQQRCQVLHMLYTESCECQRVLSATKTS